MSYQDKYTYKGNMFNCYHSKHALGLSKIDLTYILNVVYVKYYIDALYSPIK